MQFICAAPCAVTPAELMDPFKWTTGLRLSMQVSLNAARTSCVILFVTKKYKYVSQHVESFPPQSAACKYEMVTVHDL